MTAPRASIIRGAGETIQCAVARRAPRRRLRLWRQDRSGQALAISAAVRAGPSGASGRGQPAFLLDVLALWSTDVPPPTSPEGRGRLLRRARGRVRKRNARSRRDPVVGPSDTADLAVSCQRPPLDSRLWYRLPRQLAVRKNRVHKEQAR